MASRSRAVRPYVREPTPRPGMPGSGRRRRVAQQTIRGDPHNFAVGSPAELSRAARLHAAVRQILGPAVRMRAGQLAANHESVIYTLTGVDRVTDTHRDRLRHVMGPEYTYETHRSSLDALDIVHEIRHRRLAPLGSLAACVRDAGLIGMFTLLGLGLLLLLHWQYEPGNWRLWQTLTRVLEA